MLSFLRGKRTRSDGLATSQLFDQDAFYKAFLRDVEHCRDELIIECPFITTRRMATLLPTLQQLTRRRVQVVINTRNPEEHDEYFRRQALISVARLQAMDVLVLYTVRHHRKLAIIDRKVTWEGSLNILSHNNSFEVMRRIESTVLAQQMISFLKLGSRLGHRGE